MSKVKTTDRDRGEKRIRRSLKELDGRFVLIGINEGAGQYPTGVAIALVGFWNEFGTVTAPERSFIRSAIIENEKKIDAERGRLLSRVLDGSMTEERALAALGFMVSEMIKTKIEDLQIPANAPSTIAGKPTIGDNPLINTRLMKRSISFEVK